MTGSTTTTATYTKLRDGSWGVRVPGSAPSQGSQITVTTKAGETKSERISRILWTGRDTRTNQTISLCAIATGRAHAHSHTDRGADDDAGGTGGTGGSIYNC